MALTASLFILVATANIILFAIYQSSYFAFHAGFAYHVATGHRNDSSFVAVRVDSEVIYDAAFRRRAVFSDRNIF